MRSDRWEYGSEFHWLVPEPGERAAVGGGAPLWTGGSGRAAFKALLNHGRGSLGWTRLWVPDYFCPEVLGDLEPLMPVCRYPHCPGAVPTPPVDHGANDVLLVVNHFGLFGRRPRFEDSGWAAVVEDHSHNPWSAWARASTADWCLASVRKALPVPDGGVLWSPTGHPLPPSPERSVRHEAAAAGKLAAMTLKSLYLSGLEVGKDVFRELQLTAERDLAAGEPAAMHRVTAEVVRSFPSATWQAQRKRNWERLAALIAEIPGVSVMRPRDDSAVPFAVVIVLAAADTREGLRRHLIANSIYPAVLWELHGGAGGGTEASVDFSRRMLAIHCDARYDDADIDRVAHAVTSYLEDR